VAEEAEDGICTALHSGNLIDIIARRATASLDLTWGPEKL